MGRLNNQLNMYSENADHITMKIPTAREKLKSQFPEDPKSDIEIVFKKNRFKLQKAYLRLESGYFKKECTPSAKLITIDQNFEEEYFTKVLSCFYGTSITVERLDLPSYYPIIKFLEIQSLLSFVRQDILSCIEHYDLFVVMAIAHQYSDQQMFEICLEQLEKQAFEQLRYNQFELLKTQLPLFKLIIKTHNRCKANTSSGIEYAEIDQILKDYCEARGLTEEKYHELKFELIDKTVLTSEEYKKIFLDEVIKYKNKASQIFEQSKSTTGNSLNLNRMVPQNHLTHSIMSPGNHGNPMMQTSPAFGTMSVNHYSNGNMNMANELTLQMQNTFEKKRNEELKHANQYARGELEKLKNMITFNQDTHTQMQEQLLRLKQKLQEKQQQEQEHKRMINKFESIIIAMQEDLEEKNTAINKLADQIEDLKNRKIVSVEEEESAMMVQSQFLPAHLISEMMGSNANNDNQRVHANKKQKENPQIEKLISEKKLEESLDDEELQALYLPRMGFDEEPVSTPKANLPKLATFITNDGFNRKSLTLIFRRSLNHPTKGEAMSIRGKESILVLIETVSGENIGGYIGVTVPKDQVDYLEDKSAFIFTLTKNQKFHIKKQEESQAIFLSPNYLISFANDLMIPAKCLEENCYCSWPSSYESCKSMKQRGFVWLVGGEDYNFKIKCAEVYEIKDEEMQMILD